MVEISAAAVKLAWECLVSCVRGAKRRLGKAKSERLIGELFEEMLRGDKTDDDKLAAILEQLSEAEPTPQLMRARRVLTIRKAVRKPMATRAAAKKSTVSGKYVSKRKPRPAVKKVIRCKPARNAKHKTMRVVKKA